MTEKNDLLPDSGFAALTQMLVYYSPIYGRV